MSAYGAYYWMCEQERRMVAEARAAKSAEASNPNRRTSSSSSFSIKSALDQMKPAQESQTPSPIYQRKRSLFGRSRKSEEKTEKRNHSVTQAAVEGALLRQ